MTQKKENSVGSLTRGDVSQTWTEFEERARESKNDYSLGRTGRIGHFREMSGRLEIILKNPKNY